LAPCLFDDAVRLGPSIGDLLVVVRLCLLGLGLGLLGSLQVTLDLLLTGLDRLAQRGERVLVEHEEHDGERDRAPDELVDRREDEVGARRLMLRCRSALRSMLLSPEQDGRCKSSHVCLLEDEGENETEQGKCLDQGESKEHRRPGLTCGLGLASHGFDGAREHESDADSRADGAQAIHETMGDGLQALVGDAGGLGFLCKLDS
jgi:hypothetical protein